MAKTEFDPIAAGGTLIDTSNSFDPIAAGGTLVSSASTSPSMTSLPQTNIPSNTGSSFQDILHSIGQYFPKPQLPLGMNVASGLMSSVMPNNGPNGQSQVMSNLPQIAMGQTPGIAQNIASGIGSSIPSLMTGGESTLGQAASGGIIGALQAQPGDELKSGLTNALTTLGLGTTLPYLNKLTTMVKPKEIATEIQGAHDALSDQATKGFKDVTNAVNDRGIASVPIDQDIFDQIQKEKYFPNTRKFNNLIDDARTGNFNSLRNLQSDLWKKGTNGAASDLTADNNQAEEMFDVRDRINEAISNHLKNTGNNDLDNLLNKSRYDYYNLRDTYYNKYLNNAVKQLVEPEYRKVPDNLMNVLQEDSKPMNHLRNTLYSGSFEPGQNAIVDLPSAINALNSRKNTAGVLKKLGWGGAGLVSLGGAIHYLHPQKMISSNMGLQNQ